jgi:hypothetical protein
MFRSHLTLGGRFWVRVGRAPQLAVSGDMLQLRQRRANVRQRLVGRAEKDRAPAQAALRRRAQVSPPAPQRGGRVLISHRPS